MLITWHRRYKVAGGDIYGCKSGYPYLDHLSGLSVIIRVLKSENRGKSVNVRVIWCEKYLTGHYWNWRGMGARGQGMWVPSSSVQFSSVAQSCPTLSDPMNCSAPGLPVRHQLPEFTQTLSIRSVMPSTHLILCRPHSFCPQSLPASESFAMTQLIAWGEQSIGLSALQ